MKEFVYVEKVSIYLKQVEEYIIKKFFNSVRILCDIPFIIFIANFKNNQLFSILKK